mmetsp:Transcript_102123/g.192124  ORF Transcript_102123/g.192124 Transcript_102123/m.192124 type:complete len:120 (-) Transcript_102123:229-588(-)
MIDSCHALKISDARLRGSIVKHSQQLSRIWKEKLDASIHSQQQLAACKDAQAACSAAQERLAAKVDALAQEIKWQGEALNSQPWTALQEQLLRNEAQQKRMDTVLGALMASNDPQVACI